ncbi:MAG: Helicase associated domain protein [Pasteurella sp.]|nr:Helicase associated domain protein [Pasteurella sp.]
MDINTLFTSGILSKRSYNCCVAAQLFTVTDINKYFEKYKNFLSLPNCGRKSDRELIDVILAYNLCNTDDATNERLHNIGKNPYIGAKNFDELVELSQYIKENLAQVKDDVYGQVGNKEVINEYIQVEISKLSVRSQNALLNHFNGIPIIDDLTRTNFLSESHRDNFIGKIKNIGSKSIPELVTFSDKIIEKINTRDIGVIHQYPSLKPQISLNEAIKLLNRKQRNIVNNLVRLLVNTLSVRNQNALTEYLENDITIYKIVEKDITPHTICKIRNIGEKSHKELIEYFSQIKDIANQLINNDTSQEMQILKRIIIKQVLKRSETQEIENLNGLLLVEYLLIEKVFPKKQLPVILDTLSIYKNSKLETLEAVGDKYGLTRERIRQIQQKAIKSLNSQMPLITPCYSTELISILEQHKTDSILHISNNILDEINTYFEMQFSYNFILYLIQCASSDYILLGNIENLLAPNMHSKTLYNWEYYYLVDNELLQLLDFNSFLVDIKNRLEQATETYQLNFENYIEKFLTNKESSITDELLNYCEYLLDKEYDLLIDIDGYITFSNNNKKTVPEYAYEALKALDKESHIERIYNKILEMHPDFSRSYGRVRASITQSNGFVPMGRDSVWGLKEWERTKENFRGGTMIDFAEEFLQGYDDPKHISEITDYVCKYRNEANENNLWQNLYRKQEQFVFFRGKYIGLLSKSYSDDCIKNIEDNLNHQALAWNRRYKALEIFLKEHCHFPTYHSTSEERGLYYWFNKQKNRYHNSELSEAQMKKIRNLMIQYNNYL